MDVKLLAEHFKKTGRTWKIGGTLKLPDEDDLQKTLDKAREALYAEPVPSELEVGGMLIRRVQEELFEVYAYVGDLPKEK